MEEDIKKLESYLKGNKIYDTELDNAVKNLIERNKELEDLYNKEKIKNRNVEMLRIACLPDNAKMVVMYKDDFNRNWRNDFIPKSKIKEKIEELRKEIKDEGVDFDWNKNSIITVLQELLED